MRRMYGLTLFLMIALFFNSNIRIFAAGDWVNINGTVAHDGTPVCAMVLANGQYMFTCTGDGSFDLNVPLDTNGNITVFAFCSGLAPYKQVIDPWQGAGLHIAMAIGAQGQGMDISCNLDAINTTWVRLSGNVTYNGTPVCAMVLANGQYVFTCAGGGSYTMNVPLDEMGSITLFGFCDGLPPYETVYTTGQINFDRDFDGDGYSVSGGDCNDLDSSINPSAEEICGDGIDQDCDGADRTCQDGVVTGSAEGLYEGYTNTGRYVTGLILNDGTFYMLYSIPGSPGIIGGIVQGNSFSSEGIISSNNAKDFNLEGQGVLSATFSGTYLPQQSISGMVSYGNSSYVSFDMFYDSAYELAPNLSKLAGTYLGEVAFPLGYEYAVLTVFPSGTVSGVGSSGCAITGFVAPGTSGNVYSVSVTFGGNPCFLSNQTMSGIAHYDSSSDKLYVALPNATRTSGVLFVGSKQ